MNFGKVGLVLTILLAIEIFYISSIPGPEFGTQGGGIVPIAYHFIVFLLFSFFLFMSLGRNTYEEITNGDWNFVVIVSLLYAISDELHQLFVPFRNCNGLDVAIDFAGIIFGILLYFLILLFKKEGNIEKWDIG